MSRGARRTHADPHTEPEENTVSTPHEATWALVAEHRTRRVGEAGEHRLAAAARAGRRERQLRLRTRWAAAATTTEGGAAA